MLKMKNKLLGVSIVMLLSFLVMIPASAAPPTDDRQEALQIINLINGYRKELGLYEYLYNATLEATAQKHTEYQASIGSSQHKGEGGTTSTQRAEAMGYGGDKTIFTDEMIYHGGYATPQAALEWWKNSPIHNAIMTSDRYHEIGVGVVHTESVIYYTVNVGMVVGVTAPGVGSPAAEAVDASAPVEIAEAGSDGSIFHLVKAGQTVSAIANAYSVPPEDILLYNGLSADQTLTEGQLLVIRLPLFTPAPVVVEEQPTPEEVSPTEAPKTVETALPPTAPLSQEAPASEASASNGANLLLVVLAGLLVLVAASVAVFAFMRLKKSAQAKVEEEEQETGKPTPFDQRSRAEQNAILQEVAEQALKAYPLELVSIEALRYALNAEYLVTARQEDGSSAKYVVRVNAPGFNNAAEINAELAWLSAIRRDTELRVPKPVAARSGEWVTTVEDLLAGQPRHCVVFEYIPGHTIEMEATPEHLEMVGSLIARLHQHGAGFTPPAGFTRKHWSLEGLKGGMLDVPAWAAYNALTPAETAEVDAAEKVVSAAMQTLGRSQLVYGLIHADLHMKSFLFHENEPLILDFDTCGYGYYIYDLAVVVWNLFDRADFAELKSALLRGYRQVRPLSEQEESLLLPFIAGRLLTQTLAWAGRRDDPNLAQAANHAIQQQVAQIKLLLKLLE